MKLCSTVLALILIVGCAARAPHPGTANAFDSDTYDTLLVAHNVIESTKSDISAGTFPANILPSVKSALNGLIDAYNTLDIIYCNPTNGTIPSTGAASLQCSSTSYHSLAAAGTASPALQSQVQSAVGNVNSATVALTTAKKGS